MMGEYPPLSDEDIFSIKLGMLKLESGVELERATVTVEFPGRTGI